MLYDQAWDTLQQVIDNLTYEDRSRFELHRDDESNYAVLYVFLHAPNTYREDRVDRYTCHEFVVPAATYDYANWRRWIFERLCSAAIHEVCEWFMDSGVRVFAPHHGNGEDPYVAWTPCDREAERVALAPGESLTA